MSVLEIIRAVVGAAEEIVPIFIHNPKSQKIEAVIITGADHALENLGSATGPIPK